MHTYVVYQKGICRETSIISLEFDSWSLGIWALGCHRLQLRQSKHSTSQITPAFGITTKSRSVSYVKVLSRYANVEITLVGKRESDTIETMKRDGFAHGYDVIVYNLCLADKDDLQMIDNAISQTRDLGVPALLMHCTMHSFQKTSPHQGWWNRWRLSRLERRWEADNGNAPFPYWGRFTGVDTLRHDWARSLEMRKAGLHPIVAHSQRPGKLLKMSSTETSRSRVMSSHFMFPIAVQPERTTSLRGLAKSVLDRSLQPLWDTTKIPSTTIPFIISWATLSCG